MSVIAPRAIITVPRIERTTSGFSRPAKPLDRRRRGARVAGFAELDRVVLDRRRVAKPQTSTTTGKTIGRRLVCSYR